MEELPISMEFLMSIDAVLAMLGGVVIGLLVTWFIQGRGFGLVGNLVTGLVGGLVGGVLFNWLDFMDVGDYADPLIAGAVGGIVLLAIVLMVRR